MITDKMKMEAISHYRDDVIAERELHDVLYRDDELSQLSRLNSIFYATKYNDKGGTRQHYQYVGIYFKLECTEQEDGSADIDIVKIDEYSFRYIGNKAVPRPDYKMDGMIEAFDRRFHRRHP
jgi:hypothetical protein